MNFLSGLSHWFGNLFHPQPQAPSPRPQIPPRMQLPPQAQAPQPSYNLGHFLAQHLGQAGNVIAHSVLGPNPAAAIQHAKQDIGGVGNAVLGDVNHLAKVISYPVNVKQYQQAQAKGLLTPQQTSDLINQAGNAAGFGINDSPIKVFRKTAGAVAGPTATILTAGAAPGAKALVTGVKPLAARVGRAALGGAGIGGTFGTINLANEQNSITPGMAARDIGSGAALGGLIGGAGPLLGRLIRGPGGKIVEAAPAKATAVAPEVKAAVLGNFESGKPISPTDMKDIIAQHRQRFGDANIKMVAPGDVPGSAGEYTYHNDMTKLAQGSADAGTVNHESVHKAIGQFLPDHQIEQLYNDVVKVSGGKRALVDKYRQQGYSDANWRTAAEEEIANRFALYKKYSGTVYGKPDAAARVANWAASKGLPDTVVKIFNGLSSAIEKHFGSGRTSAQNLENFYNKLDSGGFNGAERRAQMYEQPTARVKLGDAAVALTKNPKVPTPLFKAALNFRYPEAGATKFQRAPAAPEALTNPTTGATDTNQTADRVLNDPNVPQASKDVITNLTHAVHNDKVMINAADNLVKTDPQTAQRVFESEQLMSSGNLDSHIHLGNSLVNEYNRVGNTAEAGKVYDQLISATTRYGQGLRAVQAISKVSPQGIVQYARNIASKNGKTVTPALEKELVDTAKTVAKMPAGPEKAAALKEMIKAAQQPGIWDKVGSFVGHVTSIPRALMATGDMSFAGRQGEVLGTRFPKEWASANAKAAQWMFSPSKFEEGMAHLANLTDKSGEVLAPTFKAMGLDLPAVTGKGEEQFSSQVLEGKVAKKLGVGHVVAGSDRAFSGAAAKLRADVAKKIIDGYGGVKGTANWSDKQLKDMGRVINTMSGRGQGSKYNPAGRTFEKWAPTLSDTLFSARLWKSRLDMLNPVFYATLAPEARKVALQSAGSFATVVSATLAAAAAVGANVETDPRSSDFGKIKVGNTRYDIMGGLQQNIVLAAREITGAKKNSAGVVQPFDGGYGHPNRLSILQDLLTNKETPVLSTISHLLTGKDIGGNPINPWTAIAQNFIPLGAQDVYGAAQDTGDTNPVTAGIKGLVKAAPTFAGIGVQTYGPSGGTATASGAGSGGSNSILSGDNTTPAYKAAQKLKTANNKAAVVAGTRLGGTTELDNAQQRIDAAQKNFPNGLPKQAKDVLTRYATLNANGKAAFNADPANKYKLAQAQYAQDKLAGKLTPTQDFQRQQALGKEAVTSKYSPQAQALYSMGKAERNAFLAANPDYAQYMGEAAAMDQELAGKGWIAKAKLSTGGGSASAKKYASLSAKIAHPTPKFKTVSVKKFRFSHAKIKA